MTNTERLAQALRNYLHLDWTLSEHQTGIKPLESPLKAATKFAREVLAEHTALASLAPAAVDRNAERTLFPDADFNNWLDDGISDCGHTVRDSVTNINDAWAGWSARYRYRSTVVDGSLRDDTKALLRELCAHDFVFTCPACGPIIERIGKTLRTIPPSAAQVAALTAQCEGLRKDAERYRWLRAGEGRPRILPHVAQAPYAFKTGEEHLPSIHDANGLNPEMLDAAIDSAIVESVS